MTVVKSVVLIKCEYKGDFRRVSCSTDTTFDDLLIKICKLFDVKPQEMMLKHRDPKFGVDLTIASQHDLVEFLSVDRREVEHFLLVRKPLRIDSPATSKSPRRKAAHAPIPAAEKRCNCGFLFFFSIVVLLVGIMIESYPRQEVASPLIRPTHVRVWEETGITLKVPREVAYGKPFSVVVAVEESSWREGDFIAIYKNDACPRPSADTCLWSDLYSNKHQINHESGLHKYELRISREAREGEFRVHYCRAPLQELSPLEYMWLRNARIVQQTIGVNIGLKDTEYQCIAYSHVMFVLPHSRPGKLLASKNMTVKYPVVMIPGIISSALEVWQNSPCTGTADWFRERLWIDLPKFLTRTSCWFEHMSLSEEGLDPPTAKVRAFEGLRAADFAADLPGTKDVAWIWAKVIQNFADVGYDPNNLFMSPYDWRLSPTNLEKRDHYFSRLRHVIEFAKLANNNTRVVVVAHSMGSPMFTTFMQWIEAPVKEGGGGFPGWVEQHIAHFVNIAGSLLGTTKALRMVVTGEMEEIRFMPGVILQPSQLKNISGRWGSLPFSFPKGGEPIYGDRMVNIRTSDADDFYKLSSTEMDALFNGSFGDEPVVLREITKAHRFGYEPITESHKADTWSNPLLTPLKTGPSTTIYCLYGVGLDAEVGYYYKRNADGSLSIDTDVNDEERKIVRGVKKSDGDNTISIESLGYMCASGWRDPKHKLNPRKSPILIHEFKQSVDCSTFMRGTCSADHVDILGNDEMIYSLLLIATGNEQQLQERVFSVMGNQTYLHSVRDKIISKI
eukprot:GILJ01012059.1.p1 GENE.GILJ01012059.1~~GILJ01012059.1.p1  ORF type:complete len:787 (-),score=104.22 GILJ01012059.1:262-2622(-)